MGGHPYDFFRWSRSVATNRDIESLGRHVFLDEEDTAGRLARGDGPRQRGMAQLLGDELLEPRDERMGALGGQIDLEEFDRHQTITLGIERAKDGTEDTRAYLMENSKRTEGVLSECAGSSRVQ